MKKMWEKMEKAGEKMMKKKDGGGLVGKTIKVGNYTVKLESLIGEGGFACIYKAREVNTREVFALKHIRISPDGDSVQVVQREARTMSKLRGHPHILRLHAAAFLGPAGAETECFMLMDYCPGTLLDLMQQTNFQLDEATVLEVFASVCEAVAHMHKQTPPLAHRDLKAENVLRTAGGAWVICDFGSASSKAQVYDTTAEIAAEEDNIRRTTTPAYRAPEMWDLLTRQRIDTKADIWALGVFLFVLLFGRLPFQGDSKLQILYGKYDMPPTGRSPVLRALVPFLLVAAPDQRPDIWRVLEKVAEAKAALGVSTSSGADAAAVQFGQQPAAALVPPASGDFGGSFIDVGFPEPSSGSVGVGLDALDASKIAPPPPAANDWAVFGSPPRATTAPAAAEQADGQAAAAPPGSEAGVSAGAQQQQNGSSLAAEVATLRAAMQGMAQANAALEGRVKKLEDMVTWQASAIERMRTYLKQQRDAQQQQQQQVAMQAAAAPLKSSLNTAGAGAAVGAYPTAAWVTQHAGAAAVQPLASWPVPEEPASFAPQQPGQAAAPAEVAAAASAVPQPRSPSPSPAVAVPPAAAAGRPSTTPAAEGAAPARAAAPAPAASVTPGGGRGTFWDTVVAADAGHASGGAGSEHSSGLAEAPSADGEAAGGSPLAAAANNETAFYPPIMR